MAPSESGESAEPTGATESGRDPVELLLDEYLAAARRGETVDVERLAARAGERAAELRDLIDSAGLLEGLKGSKPRVSFRPPSELGDYRIVGEIGRGGMGVVYEAHQLTLGRRVALKVLPPHALQSGTRLERFKREAQTAAKLHHTNIVPIFGVGEQDGLHFYVMQLIVGRPLDEVIRALRGDTKPARSPSRAQQSSAAMSATSVATAIRDGVFAPPQVSGAPVPAGDAAYFRSVARIGEQVADALVYAHTQGTLHRDIKPANLILDGDGVVWITDFGLAKAMEDVAVTNSSDLVGTLQYMAPEQLLGDADARTDVHGLGLVLYELAALRPAFVADSRGELYERVRNEEPPLLRHVRGDVPRDLETIVRKAIAKDPRHRYQSAAEIADDLRRFLEDRPIRARPVSALEQVWRWGRRNRTLASLAALALLGLVSTALVAAWGYFKTSEALATAKSATGRAEQNLKSAELATERARQNLAMAMSAFDDVFARVVGPELLRPDEELEGEVVAPGVGLSVSADDAALLEELLRFYDRFAQANEDNTAARLTTARAYHRVGEILRQLARSDEERREAIEAYRRALGLYEALAAAGDVQKGVVAQVLNDLGRALRDHRQIDEMRATYERALTIAPDSSKLSRYERARAHDNLASARSRRGRGGRAGGPGAEPGSAVAHHREALRLGKELVEEEPTNAAYVAAVARTSRLLASALGEGEEATGLRERAVDTLTALAAAHPKSPQYRFELMEALVGGLLRGSAMGRELSGEELARLQRATEIGSGLVETYPGVPSYEQFLASLAMRIGLGTAEHAPETAIASIERLLGMRESLGVTLGDARRANELACLQASEVAARIPLAGLDDATRTRLRTLVDRLADLVEASGPIPPRSWMARAAHSVSISLERLGDPERARRLAERQAPR